MSFSGAETCGAASRGCFAEAQAAIAKDPTALNDYCYRTSSDNYTVRRSCSSSSSSTTPTTTTTKCSS
jgi:hypothetical protein